MHTHTHTHKIQYAYSTAKVRFIKFNKTSNQVCIIVSIWLTVFRKTRKNYSCYCLIAYSTAAPTQHICLTNIQLHVQNTDSFCYRISITGETAHGRALRITLIMKSFNHGE